ncbi:type II secretion system F family protein [Neorhodopirellula pilleata]|uniref:Bacterial type II secretion system protein F domain protein n=1 Tax=Neorhodopirellula pilleata TaxID=2714738 RepID=A0A5C5ZYV3_9BACT|nr:type II secretion system F family protein [Neorhodopirellula pilleata]TWT92245.1 Bacterial type II secretion system protein F domain protein [Neorhodopirellula pilleata]
MNVTSPLLMIAGAGGIGMLAGTIRTIRLNLVRRPPDRVRLWPISVLVLFEWLLWYAFLIAILLAAPHPTTILLLVLMVAAIITASRLRYSEETRSLNRWLHCAAEVGAPLPVVVESVSDGLGSRLASQAKSFVRRVNIGVPVIDAARKSRLPIEADTFAAMVYPDVSREQTWRASNARKATDALAQRQGTGSTSLVPQHMTYAISMILMAWLFGKTTREFLIRLRDEFDNIATLRSFLHESGLFSSVQAASNVIALLVVTWVLAAWVIRYLPLGMVRWIPWFGPRWIDQRRCEILNSLHRGMRVGHPVGQILEFAEQTARTRWSRRRCQTARRLIDDGKSVPVSLQRARLITTSEQAWLTAAEANGHLPHAIEHLCDNIHRRQTLRWKRRMAWFVPLTTVLVGLFVLMHAFSVFEFLSHLILIFS